MPAEPLDAWLTSPFALTRIDDVLWGRGADDNKTSRLFSFRLLLIWWQKIADA